MSRSRLAAVALVAGLLVSGCTDDDPKPNIADPTPSESTSSATTTTSPTVSATPALGPEATVRAWVEAWNGALLSGDTDGLDDYETLDCRNCADLANVIDDAVSAGGSFEGGNWAIISSKVVPLDGGRLRVNVAMNVAAGSTTNAAGEDPVQFEADKRIVVYELDNGSGTWLIDVIELLS
jgi:hypothetical protein